MDVLVLVVVILAVPEGLAARGELAEPETRPGWTASAAARLT